MKKENYSIKNINDNIKKYLNIENALLDTYKYIEKLYSKEELDYVLETCYILTTLYADIETLKASLIYKLLTEKIIKDKELENKFDFEVIKLSKGAYKLDKIIYFINIGKAFISKQIIFLFVLITNFSISSKT